MIRTAVTATWIAAGILLGAGLTLQQLFEWLVTNPITYQDGATRIVLRISEGWMFTIAIMFIELVAAVSIVVDSTRSRMSPWLGVLMVSWGLIYLAYLVPEEQAAMHALGFSTTPNTDVINAPTSAWQANWSSLRLRLDPTYLPVRALGVHVIITGMAISLFRNKPESQTCPQCGYSLRGNPSAGCPECGWSRGGRTGRRVGEE